MNLDTFSEPELLYRARGDDVEFARPLFTGDVFRDVAVPGTQEGGMAMIMAHPCSFRRAGGRLTDRVVVCSVRATDRVGNNAWRSGFLNRMPLPDVAGEGSWAAFFDELGRATTDSLRVTERLACLSDFGINMLQQRLTCHLTRVEIPTQTFNQAFSHTYEEAELLEEWTIVCTQVGMSVEVANEEFETFIRSGEPSLQSLILDSQKRPHVRRACREGARVLAEQQLAVEIDGPIPP
jgi:hypothetical protein